MTTDMPTYRVLLVDDHQAVRRALRVLLEEPGRLAVIGEAGTVKDAVREAARLRPDVIVMDLRLPDGTGVEACRAIRGIDPDVRVVILTSFADEDALRSAVAAGAAGYVLKDLDPSTLHDSLVTVAEGGSLLDPKPKAPAPEGLSHGEGVDPSDVPSATLTPLEDRILAMIRDGLTNQEIGDRLSLAERTIRSYVAQIHAKLCAGRLPGAARLATKRAEQRP